MPVSMLSDDEDVQMDKRKAQGPSKRPTQEDIDPAYGEAIEDNQGINEEYKIWKKNAPFLYDVVITHALDWPSLTVQWFPDRESPGEQYTNHRLLLGTHTSGQANDYVQIASLELPKRDDMPGEKLGKDNYDEESGELRNAPAYRPTKPINITQRIGHEGEVNRARYMPQNPDLIATKTTKGDVWVFDRTKHPSKPDKENVFKPDIILNGMNKDGFGLAWSELKPGHIISSGEDTTVCKWDINAYSRLGNSLRPTQIFKCHDSCVNDVSWNPYQEDVFASVGDDGLLVIWDARVGEQPVQKIQAHGGKSRKDSQTEALAVAYSPANENLLLTGGADSTIILHDLRSGTNISTGKETSSLRKLHTFHAHTDQVLQLAWSPHVPSVFASGSGDRRVNIWDLAQIGQEQTQDDAEDGPPELMFIHGGHISRIADIAWAPHIEDKWTLASAGEDNVLMVWSPTWRIWASDEVRPKPSELERPRRRGVVDEDEDEDEEIEDEEDEEMSAAEGDVEGTEGTDTERGHTDVEGEVSVRSSLPPSERSVGTAPKSASGDGDRHGMEED